MQQTIRAGGDEGATSHRTVESVGVTDTLNYLNMQPIVHLVNRVSPWQQGGASHLYCDG